MPSANTNSLKTIFSGFCFIGAAFTVVSLFLQYIKNDDVSSTSFHEFAEEKDHDHPTFTLCLTDKIFKQGDIFKSTLKEYYNVDKIEYVKYLEGEPFKETKQKILAVDYADVIHQPDDVVIDFHSRDSQGNEMNTWTTRRFIDEFNCEQCRSKAFLESKIGNSTFPFFTSYRSPHELCFTKNTSHNPSADVRFDQLTLDMDMLNIVKTSNKPDVATNTSRIGKPANESKTLAPFFNSKLRIYLHDPGQLVQNFNNDVAEYTVKALGYKNSNNLVSIRLQQIMRLHKRADANEPCDSKVTDEDTQFMEYVIQNIGCIPLYWKSFFEGSNNISACTSVEQFQTAHRYIGNSQNVVKLYMPSCKSTTILSLSESIGMRPEEFWTLRVFYQPKTFIKIINTRAMGFESFGGGAGGFIGVFLGYSLMQIPDLILYFLKLLCPRY